MNTFTQSQSLFNCLKYIHIYFGYSRNPLSRRYRNNNFVLDLLKIRAGWHCEKRKYTYTLLFPWNRVSNLKARKWKKKYIDESWESYLAWAMIPRNQIYLDLDIYENKVKVNCKIIFFYKHWYIEF